jgi:hypothetical protein
MVHSLQHDMPYQHYRSADGFRKWKYYKIKDFCVAHVSTRDPYRTSSPPPPKASLCPCDKGITVIQQQSIVKNLAQSTGCFLKNITHMPAHRATKPIFGRYALHRLMNLWPTTHCRFQAIQFKSWVCIKAHSSKTSANTKTISCSMCQQLRLEIANFVD